MQCVRRGRESQYSAIVRRTAAGSGGATAGPCDDEERGGRSSDKLTMTVRAATSTHTLQAKWAQRQPPTMAQGAHPTLLCTHNGSEVERGRSRSQPEKWERLASRRRFDLPTCPHCAESMAVQYWATGRKPRRQSLSRRAELKEN
eukprot:scaffold4124_cov109-Isochrysis_galbana.AAC.5